MRFFIIFYLAIQCVWASYGGYSSSSNSRSGMALNLPRIDIRIEKFISTAKEMERKERENGTENKIKEDWYKRDEAGEIIKGKNFQNHILKILTEELVERFGRSEASRSEMVESILLYLNEFIGERFIPGAYQAAIKKIFERVQSLQFKPAPLVTNIVFKELSEPAQYAFRDGKRVQASGLERAPTVKDNMRADPLLVELLFMQIVWDTQKRDGTRQELLNTIERSMVKMEQLFGSDPAYTIVGTFSSLRSTLVEETQKESPLPALVKYIMSLITEGKKELEEKHAEFLRDESLEEWKEITKTKTDPAVSIWVKKDVAPQESEEEKRDRFERERDNQAEKARKKAQIKAQKDKKFADKEGLKKLKVNAIDSAKNKGIETAKGAFDSAMSSFFGSIKKILPGGSSGGLGGLFG